MSCCSKRRSSQVTHRKHFIRQWQQCRDVRQRKGTKYKSEADIGRKLEKFSKDLREPDAADMDPCFRRLRWWIVSCSFNRLHTPLLAKTEIWKIMASFWQGKSAMRLLMQFKAYGFSFVYLLGKDGAKSIRTG